MPITGDSIRLRIQRGESLRSYVARTLYLNFGKHELSSLANGNILTKDVRKIASILGWSGCHGFNRLLHEHTNYPINSVFKDDHDISYSLASYTNSRYVIESSALGECLENLGRFIRGHPANAELTENDNWNGGTNDWEIHFIIPALEYAKLGVKRIQLQERITTTLRTVTEHEQSDE
ncbi:hypothetical protein ACW9ID_08385 [Pseudomonas gingeri]